VVRDTEPLLGEDQPVRSPQTSRWRQRRGVIVQSLAPDRPRKRSVSRAVVIDDTGDAFLQFIPRGNGQAEGPQSKVPILAASGNASA
jgi:hypothetical protein